LNQHLQLLLMAAKQEKQRQQRQQQQQVLQAPPCSHLLLTHSMKLKTMTMALGTLMRHQLLPLYQPHRHQLQQQASTQH
jgi:hypothetical protein